MLVESERERFICQTGRKANAHEHAWQRRPGGGQRGYQIETVGKDFEGCKNDQVSTLWVLGRGGT